MLFVFGCVCCRQIRSINSQLKEKEWNPHEVSDTKIYSESKFLLHMVKLEICYTALFNLFITIIKTNCPNNC